MSAFRCHCDPREIAGLLPGRRCPHCHWLREPMVASEALILADDEKRNLRSAVALVDLALTADDDGDKLGTRRRLDCAADAAQQAANALRFASASLHFNEEGRPTTAMAGARDQDYGRQP